MRHSSFLNTLTSQEGINSTPSLAEKVHGFALPDTTEQLSSMYLSRNITLTSLSILKYLFETWLREDVCMEDFPKAMPIPQKHEEIRFFPILISKTNMQHVCISTLFLKNTSSGTTQTQGKKKTVHIPSRVDGRPSETDNRPQKVESVGNTLFFHRVDFQLLL